MIDMERIDIRSSPIIDPHGVGGEDKSNSYLCLPKGRHSDAAHEKRLLLYPKMYQGWGGVGHEEVVVGWVMKGWGGVGWGGSCRVWWVMQGCGGSRRGVVGHTGVGVSHAGLGWVM